MTLPLHVFKRLAATNHQSQHDLLSQLIALQDNQNGLALTNEQVIENAIPHQSLFHHHHQDLHKDILSQHLAFAHPGVLDKASLWQFTSMGAVLGGLLGLVEAAKHPALYRLTLDDQTWQDLSYRGTWKGTHPSESMDYRIHEGNTLSHSYGYQAPQKRVFSWWPFGKDTPERLRKRHYIGNTFVDHIAERSVKDGSKVFKQAIVTAKKTTLHSKCDYCAKGNLKKVTHYTPLTELDITLHPPQGHAGHHANTLIHQSKDRDYHFHHTNDGSQHFETIVDHINYVVHVPTEALNRADRSSIPDHGKIYTKKASGLMEEVSFHSLDKRVQEALLHPLAMRNVFPHKNATSLMTHLNTPLVSPKLADVAKKGAASLEKLSKDVQKIIPWKPWLLNPLIGATVGAAGMYGIYIFLFSPKSPFTQWLNTHLVVKKKSEQVGLFKHQTKDVLQTTIKNTGSDRANDDIGQAIEVLRLLGVIQTHDNKPK